MSDDVTLVLYDCLPLHARITRRQCEANRARGVWACPKCPGLFKGAPVTIEKEVEVGKAAKCSKGCGKQAQKGKNGMCCSCWREDTGTPKIKRGEVSRPTVPVAAPGKSLEERLNDIKDSAPPPRPDKSATGRVGLLTRLTPAPVPNRPGFFLDFTGHEDLLTEVGPICPELNAECIELIRMLMAGDFCLRQAS